MAASKIPRDAVVKQIGFFGGTFDPIHFGHLNLAMELLEKGKLDEILFCPAHCSPFKVKKPPIATPQERYEMLAAVLADFPSCEITPIEIERKGPSYTIDTLRQLQKKGTQYRLILSEEAVERFHEWHEPEELLRLAPPIIGSRSVAHSWSGPYGEKLKKNIVKTSLFDISSTEVRERLRRKLCCAHLIPQKALDYINQNDLYFSS